VLTVKIVGTLAALYKYAAEALHNKRKSVVPLVTLTPPFPMSATSTVDIPDVFPTSNRPDASNVALNVLLVATPTEFAAGRYTPFAGIVELNC
jgi:hypothetical protein